jgi:hypothetical protein
MRFAELLSVATIAAGVSTVVAEDAPIIKNNPPGGVAFATINKDNGALDAVIAVSTSPTGEGVQIVMNINGATPISGGPFSKSFLWIAMCDKPLMYRFQCTTFMRKPLHRVVTVLPLALILTQPDAARVQAAMPPSQRLARPVIYLANGEIAGPYLDARRRKPTNCTVPRIQH